MTHAAAVEIRRAIEEFAYLVTPTQVATVTREPDDDHVLAAAISGPATYVVTRDHDLLMVRSYKRVQLLEPSPALGKLRAPEANGQSTFSL